MACPNCQRDVCEIPEVCLDKSRIAVNIAALMASPEGLALSRCGYCGEVDCPDPDRHSDWLDILYTEKEEYGDNESLYSLQVCDE